MFGYASVGKHDSSDVGADGQPAGALGPLAEHAARLAPDGAAPLLLTDAGGFAEQVAQNEHTVVWLRGNPRLPGGEAATAETLLETPPTSLDATLASLNGAFALARYDRAARRLELCVDRLGIYGLAWSAEASRVCFAETPGAIASSGSARPQLRRQAIYDYFFFHMVPSPGTVFDGIYKLPAATVITFDAAGRSERRYWQPTFARQHEPFDALRGALHGSLEQAVSDMTCEGAGAFLSGGLDSSTVAGILAKVANPARTFSMGFGESSFDELEFARITNDHFGCEGNEYQCTPEDLIEAIPVVAASYTEPFGNSSAVPTYLCARFARERGITRLLAGDGGDELFGGNERYVRQGLFELFNRLPAPARRFAGSAVRSLVPEGSTSPLRKLRSYVEQAEIPLPERFESWNYVYREGASHMFSDTFAGQIDRRAPFRHMGSVFAGVEAGELLDRMLVYDWRFTLADNDLRKVTTMCHAAGVEVEYPFLDNRVVEMSLRVPSSMKIRRMELRSFYKRAMRGFLADATLTKSKHGFGLPFGVWLKTNEQLAALVFDSLTSLKSRDIVTPSFIDSLIDAHRGGDAGYFGYVIWDLLMLELWIQHHCPDATLI